MPRKNREQPSIESAKVYCTCDEITGTIFDRMDLIEAVVRQHNFDDHQVLSGGVILEFFDRDARSKPVGGVVFFMSHAAAARLGRKLIASSKLEDMQ